MLSSHCLPIGWEQRIEPPTKNSGTRRVFYMDHNARSTQLADPRMGDTGDKVQTPTQNADAVAELQILCSGVLPEQAVSPADFRAALNRTLRHELDGLTAEGSTTPGGLRACQLQLQQHIQRAVLERLLGHGMPFAMPLAHAHASYIQTHQLTGVTAVNPDSHVMSSLLKHASYADLMGTYMSGARLLLGTAPNPCHVLYASSPFPWQGCLGPGAATCGACVIDWIRWRSPRSVDTPARPWLRSSGRSLVPLSH